MVFISFFFCYFASQITPKSTSDGCIVKVVENYNNKNKLQKL